MEQKEIIQIIKDLRDCPKDSTSKWHVDICANKLIDKLETKQLILSGVSNSTKTRADRRNKHAENVCREARFQLARHGGIVDNNKISELVLKWLTYGRKICYKPL
jgi:hypothetical protein